MLITKNISAGEGGAIVTDNERYYKYTRNYSDMGAVRNRFPDWNADDTVMGQNYRMNRLCGAVLCAQLEKIDYMISHQKESCERIYKKINGRYDAIIHSKDPGRDTGMNILIVIHYKAAIQLANQYNVEIRKMWNNLYFKNLLFQNAYLTDVDLRLTKCKKTLYFSDELAVISVPPVLNYENEDIIAKLINELLDNSYLGSVSRIG